MRELLQPRHRWDAALHLLDRQIIDQADRLIAKVDDLELTTRADGRLEVTALLTGPGALGYRIGGRLGGWTVAIWRRLHPAEHPAPTRIPLADVTGVDSAVHVTDAAGAAAVGGLERWVNEYVIRPIPGSGHDPD